MPHKENFTAKRVAELLCPPGKAQAIYWDAKAPGLGLRVTANGTRSFVFESRVHGQTIRLTIGDPRAWPIAQAQAEAIRLKVMTDQGIDPRQVRRDRALAAQAAKATEKRETVTVREAWDAYVKARTPKWGARHLRNHEAMAKAGGDLRTRGRRTGESILTQPGPLSPLLGKRLADLDARAIHDWLKPLAERTPTQAAQTYRALRAFLAWCADQEAYREVTHADACNRRLAREVLPKSKAKTDCLQREQLPAWFAEVRKIRNPVIAAYLQVLLLTGARREELAELRWDDVDFRWKGLRIRDKVEGRREIPLTPYVDALLRDLKARNDTPPPERKPRGRKRPPQPASTWKPSEWVFQSPKSATGHVAEPRKAHELALQQAGIPHISLHGLRRSFGTLAEWVECPAGISAQIMGHKPSATAEKHYRARPLDLLRMWHTKIEAWMLGQATIELSNEGAGTPLAKGA